MILPDEMLEYVLPCVQCSFLSYNLKHGDIEGDVTYSGYSMPKLSGRYGRLMRESVIPEGWDLIGDSLKSKGRCFIFRSEATKTIIFSFRGTIRTFSDLAADYKISKGYVDSWEQEEKFIEEIMAREENQGYAEIYTGHSLGGHIAELIALQRGNIAITFDSPGNHLKDFTRRCCLDAEREEGKQTRIFSIVGQPNFVNTSGKHPDRLFYLSCEKKAEKPPDWLDAFYNVGTHAVAKMIDSSDRSVSTAKVIGAKMAGVLTGDAINFAVSYLRMEIPKRLLEQLQAAVGIAVENTMGVAEKGTAEELLERVELSLKSHKCENFLAAILDYKSAKNIHKKIFELDREKWPTCQDFLKFTDANAKRFYDYEEYLLKSPGVIVSALSSFSLFSDDQGKARKRESKSKHKHKHSVKRPSEVDASPQQLTGNIGSFLKMHPALLLMFSMLIIFLAWWVVNSETPTAELNLHDVPRLH